MKKTAKVFKITLLAITLLGYTTTNLQVDGVLAATTPGQQQTINNTTAKCFTAGQSTNPVTGAAGFTLTVKDPADGHTIDLYTATTCQSLVADGYTNISLTANKCYRPGTRRIPSRPNESEKVGIELNCLQLLVDAVRVAELRQACTNNPINCADTSTSTNPSVGPKGYNPSLGAVDQNLEDSPFFKTYLIPTINVLSGGIVALAAVMMVIAGIQYSAGRDNPQLVSAAKARIVNVLIGLVAYLFIYGFLQWIIPGGVF